VRRNIANSSASDNAFAPRLMSFSRGLSALGQSEIAMGIPLPVILKR
jgi:hypothetical protein